MLSQSFRHCWTTLLALGSALAQPQSCRLDGPLLPLREIPEASGLALSRRSPGVLWTHNDSGEPIIFGLDFQGHVKGRIRVANAQIEDWEDLAVGPCPRGSCLYIGDIGDNSERRQRITIYRTPEPALTDTATEPTEAFHATYPDGPHDAEALFVTPDAELFVVTKSELALYRFPKPLRAGATAVLERVRSVSSGVPAARKKLAKGARITGASASPDGRWVALRTNLNVHFYRMPDLLSGAAEAFRFDLRALKEPQGEGIALGDHGTVFLSSEGGSKTKPGTLGRIDCTLPR